MDLVLQLCLGGLGIVVVLGLVRLALGPTVIDRMIAFDLVAVAGVGVIAILSVQRGTTDYLELILVYSMLGFLSTVALTQYLQKTVAREGPGGGRKGGPHD